MQQEAGERVGYHTRGADGGGDAPDLLDHSPAVGGHGERVVSGGTGGPGVHGGMVQVQYNRVAGVSTGRPPSTTTC